VFWSSIETDVSDPDHALRQLAEVGRKRKVGSKEGVTLQTLPDVTKVVQLTRDLNDLDRRLAELICTTGPLQMEQRSFLGQKYSEPCGPRRPTGPGATAGSQMLNMAGHSIRRELSISCRFGRVLAGEQRV
jgi:hypothetical protein